MTDVKLPDTCYWTPDADKVYFTDCASAFQFNDGTSPEENNFLRCPFCGKRLETQHATH